MTEAEIAISLSRRALATDLYELTMMAGYYGAGLTSHASFELYVRALPAHRSFLIAAGLDQALELLEQLRFTPDDIEYVRALPAFHGISSTFFDEYLPRFTFSGEVWAVEEGTPVFPPAPLLRVTAPLPEAQLVETALLAQVTFQTSVASRAVRMVHAAEGRPVIEYGARRAHGIEAGIYAARAAVIGGCRATSNVEAARRFAIPPSGTMAHSWVMAFPDELAAFRAFCDTFGNEAVLLLDTYDTIRAAKEIVASGLKPRAVRLDSGDIVELSKAVRAIFDSAGLRDTRIFVSGDLDEWRIADLVAQGAQVDGFGVGGALSTVSDAPSLGGVYKIVEIERGGRHVPIMKSSPGKQTGPGRKQVWRVFQDSAAETAGASVPETGLIAIKDVIGLAEEAGPPRAQPLLKRVMFDGRRVHPSETIDRMQKRCREGVAQLPEAVRRLSAAIAYPVESTAALRATTAHLERSQLAR